MHRIFLPNVMWLVMIFWVVPALPGSGLGIMVLVSARAQGFQDANQMGSGVVLVAAIASRSFRRGRLLGA
jgi:ABC-2 type transport system permease protein